MNLKNKRYNVWGGNPEGVAYDPKCCAYKIFNNRFCTSHQCSRPKGHGEDELYCKQHAKKRPSKEDLAKEEHC